jgi:putative ABC transport system permease protein
MRWLRGHLVRLGGWRNRAARESELQAEIEANFQMQVDDNLRVGMEPAEARRAAALRFGSLDSTKEAVRDCWTLAFLEQVRQDAVYAWRGLRRNPGFAATAILSLALGSGAAIAIFTVADGVLLRPLPFPEPGRLVMVWERNTLSGRPPRNVISPANFLDWKKQNTVFESIGAFGGGSTAVDTGSGVEEVGIQYVTFDMLPLLGVRPWRGRLFTREEDLPNAPDVVILSHRLWQSRFAGSDSAIGRKIQVSGNPATIVGVMPPGFYFRNRETDLWATVGLDPARDYRKGAGRSLLAAARLKPGVPVGSAQAEMTAIAARLEKNYPEFDTHWTVNVEPLRDSLVYEVKTSMYVLLGAVALLMGVACANVANLLLARYTARRREMAVRAAIGAGQWRVVRQTMTESLVLGTCGGLLGLVVARASVAGLLWLAPRDLTRTAEVVMDLRIVAFAIGLSVLTSVLFGLIPAISAARSDVLTGLREGARGATGGHGARNALVAAEVALAIVLMAGAGLLFRTLAGLQAVDTGLNPENLLTFRVGLPNTRYPEVAKRLQFFNRALERMRSLPGVRSASAINTLPFQGFPSGTGIQIAGEPEPRPGERHTSTIRTVSPGYFSAIGIPVRQGRDFDARDNTLEAPYRFIVNETFVRRYLQGKDPLRQSVMARMQDVNPYGQIVGVVGDVKEGSVDKDPAPTVYYNQAHMGSGGMYFVLRADGRRPALAESVRAVIREMDSALPVADLAWMEDVVSETFARQRFSAVLLIGFSAIGLMLAAIGLYGVLAYAVTERTREIGIRMALGADAGRVIAMVAASGACVVAVGTAAGLAGAFVLTGLLRSMLFGVEPHDAVTFIAVPCLLALVAMAAAYLPARRASRVAPAEALRAD